MDIRSAMDRIVVIQSGLKVTAPHVVQVKKAWKYFPPQAVAVPELPCFMNDWTLVSEERYVALRIQRYTVHMQLFAGRMQGPEVADIASAFMPEIVDAFDEDITLARTVTQNSLRGGVPTLVRLDHAEVSYLGLDLFLDLEMKEAKEFS